MRVNPYSQILLDLTIGLLRNPPGASGDLEARWIAAGMPIEDPPGQNDGELIDRYLADWRKLIGVSEESDRARLINAMLLRYASVPSMTNHDGSGWHLHYRPERASLAEALAAATTVALAEHLAAHGIHRLGRCALSECGEPYIDHSRPGKQRYCTQLCANRDAVRRHRNRQRGVAG